MTETQFSLPTLERGDYELGPPVYRVESWTACWKCGKETGVATVGATSFLCLLEPAARAEPYLYVFSDIWDLPVWLLEVMRRVNPGYRRRFSRQAGTSYFMNHCSCGAQFGDFFMHSEPGAAFCPVTPDAARAVRLRQLDVPERLVIGGSPSTVSPNLILDYAQRV